MKLRSATQEDLERWYASRPVKTLRGAIVGLVDGEPKGIAGYYIQDSVAVVVSEMRLTKEEAKRHGPSIFRAARMVLREVKKTGILAQAVPDPSWPNAERFLSRLGFTPITDRMWVWQP